MRQSPVGRDLGCLVAGQAHLVRRLQRREALHDLRGARQVRASPVEGWPARQVEALLQLHLQQHLEMQERGGKMVS